MFSSVSNNTRTSPLFKNCKLAMHNTRTSQLLSSPQYIYKKYQLAILLLWLLWHGTEYLYDVGNTPVTIQIVVHIADLIQDMRSRWPLFGRVLPGCCLRRPCWYQRLRAHLVWRVRCRVAHMTRSAGSDEFFKKSCAKFTMGIRRY